MPRLTKGRYAAGRAETPDEIAACLRLRHLVFRADQGPAEAQNTDTDAFDGDCLHMRVTDTATDALVCCFRILPLTSGAQIARSYSAQFYDLKALESFAQPMAEIGRFCIHPAHSDPDILRVAWGALTAFVDAEGIGMLFGCASFAGTNAAQYRSAFALLGARHLAPQQWRPQIKAPDVLPFAQDPAAQMPDLREGLRRMPPLLRSYLAMGGWVSDHAVVDADMNTLHVFTGVEVAAIPPARARLLRASAAA